MAAADTGLDRLYDQLRCPTCSSGPRPGARRCGGCGRLLETDSGLLDLLPDDVRADADRFAERYRALRVREGWVAPTGREDPDHAGGRWRRRIKAVQSAAAVLERGLPDDPRPVVADVGAGSGWAARLLSGADVMAFDLLNAPGSPGPAIRIRADMRRLPLTESSVDGLLYTAAIHYVPIDDAIREAARVLRPGGLLVAIESPMYVHQRAADRAAERSARYYAAMGFADLAGHYHPVDVRGLKATLTGSGFWIERFEMPPRWLSLWRRLTRSPRFPTLVCRLNK